VLASGAGFSPALQKCCIIFCAGVNFRFTYFDGVKVSITLAAAMGAAAQMRGGKDSKAHGNQMKRLVEHVFYYQQN
jgi:hypothetical protein